MAIYDFVCRECRKKFQIERAVSRYDPKKVKCPKCSSKKVDRRLGQVFATTSKKS